VEAELASAHRIPPGGLDNFNSGFLPAAYQGSILGTTDPPLANIRSLDKSPEAQGNKFRLMRQLDQIEETSSQVMPMMQRMIETLESFIELDVPGRRLHLDVDAAELERRRAEWREAPRPARGWAKLYIDHVQQAHLGADLDILVGGSGDAVERDSH
jgi:hypothetical protein